MFTLCAITAFNNDAQNRHVHSFVTFFCGHACSRTPLGKLERPGRHPRTSSGIDGQGRWNFK